MSQIPRRKSIAKTQEPLSMYLPVFFERYRRNAYQSEEAEPKHAFPPIF